jgi:integrase
LSNADTPHQQLICGSPRFADQRTRHATAAPEPGSGRRHPPCEGSETARCSYRRLAICGPAKALVAVPAGSQLRVLRDRAVLAMLVGCGLRRAELVTVKVEDFQLREDHLVLPDIIGRGGHMQTVPIQHGASRTYMPGSAQLTCRAGFSFALWKDRKGLRYWVYPESDLVDRPSSSLHLRLWCGRSARPGRTCARLCHHAGGELEQIQFLLGNVSVQTTDRYLGCK